MNVPNLSAFESLLVSCFQSLLLVSAVGSIVVLIAIAFHVITSKWISASWLYLLWFVVLSRFVLFAAPESPTSFLNLVAQPKTAISAIESTVEDTSGDGFLIFSSENVIPIPIDEQTATFSWSQLNIWKIAALVWLLVVIGSLCRLGVGFLRVKRLINQTALPPSDLEIRFEELKQQFRLRERTRLRISDEIEVPAMAGLLSPVVILPSWCCHELDNEQLEMVFTHELVHIQRRDGLIQLVAHLIVVLHWFNPLTRTAARFIDSNRELSCDRRVIELWKKTKQGRFQSGSAHALLVERKYGKTILEIAGRSQSGNNATQFNAALMGGFTGSNQHLIKQRIAMLVSSSSPQWLRNIFAAGFVTLLLAVGFTSAQTVTYPQAVCPPDETVAVQLPPDSFFPPLPVPDVMPELPRSELPSVSAVDSAQGVWLPQSPMNGLPVGAILPQPVNGGLQQLSTTPNTEAKPRPNAKPIRLNAGEVKDISFDYAIPEIVVRDPAILTATLLSQDRMRFTAVAPGKTEVHVFNLNREAQTLRFHVVPDVRELNAKLKEKFPELKVGVTGMTDGFVNLVGQVATAEQITKINEFVTANCNLPVRNQLTDKDPVAIKVKVYEVSTTKLQTLGIDWSKIDKNVPSEIKSLRSLLPNHSGTPNTKTLDFAKLEGDQFDKFLERLEQHNIAKLLDQPILVARPGHMTEYFSGGKVPIAVINEKGQPTVEFRSYGTKIQVTPLFHAKAEMTLEILAEVSEVCEDLADSTGVPGFRVRRINTGLRLNTGDSIALVGDYKHGKNNDAESTELVFLLTPRTIELGPEFKLTRKSVDSNKEPREKTKRR
jgi:beta-lactamase regulating signal transducer with metallopeptidase domain/Flp pilus assembly secretin CpaC